MNGDQAWEYLRPPPEAFWRWSDCGDEVTWHDGTLIIFRQQLCEVLHALAPLGLPPLTEVLLLQVGAKGQFDPINNPSCMLSLSKSLGSQQSVVYSIVDCLSIVKELAEGSPQGFDLATLGLAIFDSSSLRLSQDESVYAVAILESWLADDLPAREQGWGMFEEEAKDLVACFKGLTVESLRTRMKTGLDELPSAPEPIELPPSERLRALLKDLENEDAYRGLARLTKQLMAATTLPRRIAPEEDLPLGGTSDITNRGSLDRLLLSELAQDNLTLAVRVAMNEALYLRRESPPASQHYHRTLFLDTGLRSWGVQRVFITAAAMAFLATAESNASFDVFRADGTELVDVDLSTKSGLEDHLAALQPTLDPREVLPKLGEQVASHEEVATPLLVMPQDGFDEPSFRSALREAALTPAIFALVSRDGTLELLERTSLGLKPMRKLQLDLAVLFESEAPIQQLINEEFREALPIAYRQNPFPIRLAPRRLDESRQWFVEGVGVFGIEKNGSLLVWSHPNQGGRVLRDVMPSDDLRWFYPSVRDGFALAVIGLDLVRVNVETWEVEIHRINVDGSLRGLEFHNGMLFATNRETVFVINADNGQPVNSFKLPRDCHWRGGRFVQRDDTWMVVSFNGQKAHLEEVGQVQEMHALLEDRLNEAIYGITKGGGIYDFTRNRWDLTSINVQATSRLLSVERCSYGRGAFVQMTPSEWVVAEFNEGSPAVFRKRSRPRRTHHAQLLSGNLSYRTIRSRFNGIGVDSNGAIVLVAAKKEAKLAVELHGAQLQLLATNLPIEKRRGFKQLSRKVPFRFQIGVASWPLPDDSEGKTLQDQAFLDGRGILHLVSARPQFPEISLVLCENMISGWCSDGATFGDPYFLGEPPNTSGEEILRRVLEPFARGLTS